MNTEIYIYCMGPRGLVLFHCCRSGHPLICSCQTQVRTSNLRIVGLISELELQQLDGHYPIWMEWQKVSEA